MIARLRPRVKSIEFSSSSGHTRSGLRQFRRGKRVGEKKCVSPKSGRGGKEREA
jgi:hypothetical protein